MRYATLLLLFACDGNTPCVASHTETVPVVEYDFVMDMPRVTMQEVEVCDVRVTRIPREWDKKREPEPSKDAGPPGMDAGRKR
jgi:hypothetical protein